MVYLKRMHIWSGNHKWCWPLVNATNPEQQFLDLRTVKQIGFLQVHIECVSVLSSKQIMVLKIHSSSQQKVRPTIS